VEASFFFVSAVRGLAGVEGSFATGTCGVVLFDAVPFAAAKTLWNPAPESLESPAELVVTLLLGAALISWLAIFTPSVKAPWTPNSPRFELFL